ncbi:MAG: hypothetical protein GEU80_09135 [Dehalococcoidia bacterium]|nr:hypothetical protein [Dehalococcoidia bacterium]
MASSKRFHLMLDEELYAAIDRQTRLEGVSKAALLRGFAREHLGLLPPIQEDPLWMLVGAASDPLDDGEPVDIDEVVYGKKAPRTPDTLR